MYTCGVLKIDWVLESEIECVNSIPKNIILEAY